MSNFDADLWEDGLSSIQRDLYQDPSFHTPFGTHLHDDINVAIHWIRAVGTDDSVYNKLNLLKQLLTVQSGLIDCHLMPTRDLNHQSRTIFDYLQQLQSDLIGPGSSRGNTTTSDQPDTMTFHHHLNRHALGYPVSSDMIAPQGMWIHGGLADPVPVQTYGQSVDQRGYHEYKYPMKSPSFPVAGQASAGPSTRVLIVHSSTPVSQIMLHGHGPPQSKRQRMDEEEDVDQEDLSITTGEPSSTRPLMNCDRCKRQKTKCSFESGQEKCNRCTKSKFACTFTSGWRPPSLANNPTLTTGIPIDYNLPDLSEMERTPAWAVCPTCRSLKVKCDILVRMKDGLSDCRTCWTRGIVCESEAKKSEHLLLGYAQERHMLSGPD